MITIEPNIDNEPNDKEIIAIIGMIFIACVIIYNIF